MIQNRFKSVRTLKYKKGVTGTHVVKNPSASAGDPRDVGLILGWEDPLEVEMATHSSALAWRIPCIEEEPGQQQFMGLQGVT